MQNSGFLPGNKYHACYFLCKFPKKHYQFSKHPKQMKINQLPDSNDVQPTADGFGVFICVSIMSERRAGGERLQACGGSLAVRDFGAYFGNIDAKIHVHIKV